MASMAMRVKAVTWRTEEEKAMYYKELLRCELKKSDC